MSNIFYTPDRFHLHANGVRLYRAGTVEIGEQDEHQQNTHEYEESQFENSVRQWNVLLAAACTCGYSTLNPTDDGVRSPLVQWLLFRALSKLGGTRKSAEPL